MRVMSLDARLHTSGVAVILLCLNSAAKPYRYCGTAAYLHAALCVGRFCISRLLVLHCLLKPLGHF